MVPGCECDSLANRRSKMPQTVRTVRSSSIASGRSSKEPISVKRLPQSVYDGLTMQPAKRLFLFSKQAFCCCAIAQEHLHSFLAVGMHQHPFQQMRQYRDNVRARLEPLQHIQDLASRTRNNLRL